jgi:hypothetical protein
MGLPRARAGLPDSLGADGPGRHGRQANGTLGPGPGAARRRALRGRGTSSVPGYYQRAGAGVAGASAPGAGHWERRWGRGRGRRDRGGLWRGCPRGRGRRRAPADAGAAGAVAGAAQSWLIVVESVGSSCDNSRSRFDLSQDLTLVCSVSF